MKYFYETHTSVAAFEVEADTDDSAMEKIRGQEGQYLIGVHTIYTYDGDETAPKDSMRGSRVIWME